MAEMEPLTRQEMILDGMDIEPITRLEYFLKKATQGGGGGSSLPPYTSADKGKVLTVGEAEPVETSVVPEQTITLDDGLGELSNVNFSGLSLGDSVNIDTVFSEVETTYTGSFAYDDELDEYYITWEYGSSKTAKIREDGTFIYGSRTSASITISATASVTPSTTKVIVPEQTVTIANGGAYLTNADFSSVSVGTSGTMTIDADSFPVVAQYLDGMIGFMAEDGGESYAIATDGTDVFFETSITGTHTVSLTASVPSVEPKWEEINGLPDTDTAHSGDVLMLDTNKNPRWGTLSSGATVYAHEWTYHVNSSTSVTAGTITTLHNTSEVRGWGVPSVPGKTRKFYVDVSTLLAAGLILTSSIVSDLNNLCDASPVDYVALTDIEVYPLKTQTITASQYINVPVLVAMV